MPAVRSKDLLPSTGTSVMRWKSITKPPVEAAVTAAFRNRPQAARLPLQRSRAFTLAELMVSVGVLVLIVLLSSQLFKATGTVTTLGHIQMNADAQGRQLLDRMAVDFAQMIKRS